LKKADFTETNFKQRAPVKWPPVFGLRGGPAEIVCRRAPKISQWRGGFASRTGLTLV